MPFLSKPIPGVPVLRDATGRLRACPEDYLIRMRLLRKAKKGDKRAVRALWRTYRVEVYAP